MSVTTAALNLSVKADTTQYESAMKGMTVHTLLGRNSIASLSHIAGVSAGPIREMAHGFLAFPGPIGVAVGSILVFKEIMASVAAVEKEVQDSHKRTLDAFEKTQSAIGNNESWGEFGKAAHNEIKNIQKDIDGVTKKIHDDQGFWKQLMAGSPWVVGDISYEQTGHEKEHAGYKADIQALKEAADFAKPLNDALRELKTDEFNLAMEGDMKSVDQLRYKMIDLEKASQVFKDALDITNVGTERYDTILEKYRQLQLEIKKTSAELDKAKDVLNKPLFKKIDDEAARVQKELDSIKSLLPNTDDFNKIQEQFKAIQDLQNKDKISPYAASVARGKLHEEQFKDLFSDSKKEIAANMSPLEVLQKKLTEIREENKEGFLSPEEMEKAIKRTQDAFDAAQAKGEKMPAEAHTRGVLSLSHAVSIGQAEVEGLKNRSTANPADKMVSEQQKTNALLRGISNKQMVAVAG